MGVVTMVDISGSIEKLKHAVYGEEVRGTLVDLARDFNERIGDGLIFVAEYGVTTHAEILAAVTKGKLIFAIRSNLLYMLCQAPTASGTRASFCRVTSIGYQAAFVSCTSTNAWSSSTTTLATQGWVNTKISTAIDSAITAAIERSY